MINSYLEPYVIKIQSLDMQCIEIFPEFVLRVFSILHNQLFFKQLTDITAVHYPNSHFDIVYHVLSHVKNERLRIKAKVQEKIMSITPIFEMANWYEREIFDMFGIVFLSHPRLERLLTEYDFDGHPLRKDFPLSGHHQIHHDGKKIVKSPVKLNQEYREFNYGSFNDRNNLNI